MDGYSFFFSEKIRLNTKGHTMKKSEKIKMLCKPTPLAKERGASSLEYLVLAAVIIIILLFVNDGDVLGTKAKDIFTGLFDQADVSGD